MRDTTALAALAGNEFGRIETIQSTRAMIVLETIKEQATVPIRGRAPTTEGGKS